jgi:hypothetical protein
MQEARMQYSVKGTNGEMLNIRADSVEDLVGLVTACAGHVELFKALALDMAQAGTFGKPTQPENVARTATPPAVDPWTTPPADTPAHVCAHGPRLRKSGTNARGPWVGWFCQLDRNDPNNCGPIFEH